MEDKYYLIFSLHNLQYGIDANLVQEIFYLPELAPIVEAPDDIVGLLNLRSRIVPVMHLGLCLGHQLQECQLSDCVIILEWKELQIGIIVNSVQEVKNIKSKAIEGEISYGRVKEMNSSFISGIAKVDTDIIMLLNPEKLFCYSNSVKALPENAVISSQLGEHLNGNSHNTENDKLLQTQFSGNHKSFEELRTFSSFYVGCCPKATPEEKAIFGDRAENLRRITESNSTGLIPLAVIGLNNEYFGLDLQIVREFTNIRKVTHIPCCPPHIIGNMNLWGEIVTIIDIRSALNLPITSATNASKVIVVYIDDVVAGVPVDEVFDVTYIRQSEVTLIPAALHSGGDEYLRGTAPFLEKVLSILDLPKILLKGVLSVNDEV